MLLSGQSELSTCIGEVQRTKKCRGKMSEWKCSAGRNNRVICVRLMWHDTDHLPAGCQVVFYANGTRASLQNWRQPVSAARLIIKSRDLNGRPQLPTRRWQPVNRKLRKLIVVISCMTSVLWHYWLGVRKSTRPAKIEWWSAGVVICLEQGAWSSWCHCHPIMSRFIKIQIDLVFLVPAYPVCRGKQAVKRVCLSACTTACKYNKRHLN